MPKSIRFKAGLSLSIGLLLGCASAEAALRLRGTYLSYSEVNSGAYVSQFGRRLPAWLHSWTPGERRRFETPEFACDYVINSDGVRDLERTAQKRAGCRRVVVFGDSFAEGVGAEREQAWPAQLEGLLRSQGADVEVLNAGVSGSDPCFELQLLRERFLRYEPDLVIVALNASDQVDVLTWGGLERFRADGTSVGRPAPAFEPLYAHSHLARWVLHELCGYHRELLVFGSPAVARWDAQRALQEACAAFAALGREQGFGLLVLVHPLPDMLESGETFYFQAFHDGLRERGIASRDLTAPLAQELAGLALGEFAWPNDRHFNARGYAAFARAVQRVLLEQGWER